MKAQALASTGALDNLQSAAVIYAELGDEASLAATQYQQAALLLQISSTPMRGRFSPRWERMRMPRRS